MKGDLLRFIFIANYYFVSPAWSTHWKKVEEEMDPLCAHRLEKTRTARHTSADRHLFFNYIQGVWGAFIWAADD